MLSLIARVHPVQKPCFRDVGDSATYPYQHHQHTTQRLFHSKLLTFSPTKSFDVDADAPLPIVIPLVAHQGAEGWKFSTEFVEHFGKFPEALRPYLTSFRHALVDLAAFNDGVISTHPRLNAYLSALKYGVRSDLANHLGAIIVDDLTKMELKTMIHYIQSCPTQVSREAIEAALGALKDHQREAIMFDFTKEYLERGRAEGLAEGLAEGEIKAKAETLMRLLENRFGKIRQNIRKRIAAADATTIDSWFDRALSASELRYVFKA
jgi:hypothetical protein